jgi:tetratricopeptide (TPR) repeat protein
MRTLSRLVAFSFLIAAVPSASAAIMVIGAGPEKQCYLASKAGKASRSGLSACNEALATAVLTTHDRAATHVNRSVMLLAHDRNDEALADTDAALQIIPGLEEAIVDRAAVLIRLDRFAEAREILNEVIPRSNGRVLLSGLFNRAIAAENLGDIKAAYKDLKRIVQLDPEFEQAQLEIARYTVVTR